MNKLFQESHKEEIARVGNLLRPRGEFCILVPNYPPFTTFDNDIPTGPLVELLSNFGELLKIKTNFVPIDSWNYEGKIEEDDAHTIAAPIFSRSEKPFSIFSFCEIGTCCFLYNTEKIKQRAMDYCLGKVYQSFEEVKSLVLAQLDSGAASCMEKYRGLSNELNSAILDLLSLSPAGKKRFAVPADHEEIQVLNKFHFPSPIVLPCSADEDVLQSIQFAADEGHIVLCSSLTLGRFTKKVADTKYKIGPLLRDEIPARAGIPFSKRYREIGKLFLSYLNSGDIEVESLLRQCQTSGVTILPTADRCELDPIPTGSLEYIMISAGQPDATEFVFSKFASLPSQDEKMQVIRGRVIRVESLDPGREAVVRLETPGHPTLISIKVERLAAARVAATGAELFYTIVDIANERRIRITANEEINSANRDRARNLVDSYIKELEQDEKTVH